MGVTSVKKVILNGSTIIDLTDTTATDNTVLSGYYFYNNKGEKREGNYYEKPEEEKPPRYGTYDINDNGTYNLEDLNQYESIYVNVSSGEHNPIYTAWNVIRDVIGPQFFVGTNGEMDTGTLRYEEIVTGKELRAFISGGTLGLLNQTDVHSLDLSYNGNTYSTNIEVKNINYSMRLDTYDPVQVVKDSALFYAPLTITLLNRKGNPIDTIDWGSWSYDNNYFIRTSFEIERYTDEELDEFITENNIYIDWDNGQAGYEEQRENIKNNLPKSITMVYEYNS